MKRNKWGFYANLTIHNIYIYLNNGQILAASKKGRKITKRRTVFDTHIFLIRTFLEFSLEKRFDFCVKINWGVFVWPLNRDGLFPQGKGKMIFALIKRKRVDHVFLLRLQEYFFDLVKGVWQLR